MWLKSWNPLVVALTLSVCEGVEYQSHPPMRPLPQPSLRTAGEGPEFFVDPIREEDANPGTRDAPCSAIQHALSRLKPGDTLYLRGGIYYEHILRRVKGRKEAPITVRSAPGELAIIDGGTRHFLENPALMWVPNEGGAQGEYCSTRCFPGERWAIGYFADSMVPLHIYRRPDDMRTSNEFQIGKREPTYCGPGLWYDRASGRIYTRLAHTKLPVLEPDEQYRAVTDPPKLPLLIALSCSLPLKKEESGYARIQGLVVRGGGAATISIENCKGIEFENVTVYSGFSALLVRATEGLRIIDCSLRGLSAPWSFRSSHKYLGLPVILFRTLPSDPLNSDFEIAYSEFTDSHDGLFIGDLEELKFHHNIVDNFDDDGIFLTARFKPGGDIYIY